MNNSIFPKGLGKQARSKLESTTLEGFGGGWNSVSDDKTMSPKFLKTLKNFHRTPSGSQKLRYGTNFFSDITYTYSIELREDGGDEFREDGGLELRDTLSIVPPNDVILDMIYFNGRIVTVTTYGYVVTVSDAGRSDVIWAPVIAAALPGAPAFWSSGLELITFVPHKNTLIIHNGVDKPITIDSNFFVTYLQDLGTGSNANTPIGKYGCVASNYNCVAGFPNSPTEVVISSKGTAGTFPLDPAPNDAISIDVGAYAPEGATEIRGIAGYGSFLIVFLQGTFIQIRLGVYNDDTVPVHTPEFSDAFPTFGLIGSRCITKAENDMFFDGIQGLSSASRSVNIAASIESNLLSSLVETEYQGRLGSLTDEQKKLNVFSVHDQLGHNLITFIPDGSAIVYSFNTKLKYKSWSEYEGMDWTCGCTSLLGRVFVAKGSKIFQLGNETFGEKYTADRSEDRDLIWTINTIMLQGKLVWDAVEEKSFLCRVSHTSRNDGLFSTDRDANPTFWEEYNGEDIAFELELPWINGKDPMKVKKLRFVSIGSKGTAAFTLECYVDNLYKDHDGVVVYDPAVSLEFMGNDAPGFGVETEEGPFGTGRRSNDPRLFNFPAKFKSVKFRIYGSTKKPLELSSLSFLFSRGLYARG